MTSLTETTEKDQRPPRIVRIQVEKLFGVLSHDVRLNREDRVTILHGINGVGKTKLLELTAALTRGQIEKLAEIPFETLRLELDDGTAIEARRSKARVKPPHLRRVRGRVPPREHTITLTRTAPGVFEDVWSCQDDENDIPVDVRMTLIRCEQAHLVETQRLLRIARNEENGDEFFVHTVDELAGELKETISAAQNEFLKKTQALDRTLTSRVLAATAESVGADLLSRLEQLAAHRARLERVGLVDADSMGPSPAPADASALTGDRALMISVHTADAEEKFKVLDPLATRLGLFLDGMNDKLGYPKKLVLGGDRTLSVRRGAETIALDQLSSGEQHELVLLYNLAFRVTPNTLVLIDEPELSLHPVWQEQFLDDILKIAAAGEFDVVVATHSPYIIGNRSDLCVELKAEPRA
jgi:predicted ATPase